MIIKHGSLVPRCGVFSEGGDGSTNNFKTNTLKYLGKCTTLHSLLLSLYDCVLPYVKPPYNVLTFIPFPVLRTAAVVNGNVYPCPPLHYCGIDFLLLYVEKPQNM